MSMAFPDFALDGLVKTLIYGLVYLDRIYGIPPVSPSPPKILHPGV